MLRLTIGSRVFAPRLWPTLLLVPVLGLLVGLGQWQLHRANEKRSLQAAFARGAETPVALPAVPTEAMRYVRVRAEGRYSGERQFLLDNITHEGVAGYRVVTPFEIDGGVLLLVDRGWIPVGTDRAQLPNVRVGERVRVVTGRLDLPPQAGMRLSAAAESGWPRRMSFPRLDALAQTLNRPLYPRLLLLDPGQPDGYVRDWQPGGMPPERHLGYAVQWFALALTLLVSFFVVNLRPAETRP